MLDAGEDTADDLTATATVPSSKWTGDGRGDKDGEDKTSNFSDLLDFMLVSAKK